VAENLPGEVKLMKNYICQATSNILNDIEKLVDVSEFMDSLTEEFTKRGNISDYNETNVKEEKKEDSKAIKEMKKEFQKAKKSPTVENKLKEKLNKIAVKIAEDPTFKDKDVYLHPDIKEACLQEKERVCSGCASINCYVKQTLCKKHNIKKQYYGKCKGKRANFSDLTHYGVIENTPTAPTHSASTISKPSKDVDYDSDAADMAQAMALFLASKTTENEEFSFSMYPVGMSTEEITRENIPNGLIKSQPITHVLFVPWVVIGTSMAFPAIMMNITTSI